MTFVVCLVSYSPNVVGRRPIGGGIQGRRGWLKSVAIILKISNVSQFAFIKIDKKFFITDVGPLNSHNSEN